MGILKLKKEGAFDRVIAPDLSEHLIQSLGRSIIILRSTF